MYLTYVCEYASYVCMYASDVYTYATYVHVTYVCEYASYVCTYATYIHTYERHTKILAKKVECLCRESEPAGNHLESSMYVHMYAGVPAYVNMYVLPANP
jgi:hypothetical protein